MITMRVVDAPGRVAQRLPALVRCGVMPSSRLQLLADQPFARGAPGVGPQATRWAPASSPVSRRISFRSETVRAGSSSAISAPGRGRHLVAALDELPRAGRGDHLAVLEHQDFCAISATDAGPPVNDMPSNGV